METFWMGNIMISAVSAEKYDDKIIYIKYARLPFGHKCPDNCMVHFIQFENDLINWLAYHYPLLSTKL